MAQSGSSAQSTSTMGIVVWAGTLALLAAAGIAANYYLAEYGRAQRDARPETYLAEAERLLNIGNYVGAMAAWHEAHERGPENPLVYKVLGDIHHRQAEWKAAVRAYEDALRYGSSEMGVALNLLTSLLELERYTDVHDRGEVLIERGFSDPLMYRYMAEAEVRSGDFKNAIPHLKQALEGSPNDLYLLTQLQRSYEETGQKGKALEVEERMSEVRRTIRQAPTGDAE